MKAKALVSCLVSGSWLLACGSEPPPEDPPDPSGPEDDVVVIATAEAVTSAAAAASNGAGGAAADASSASASTSGGSGDRTSSAATGEAATGAAAASGGAATDASTTGEPGAGGAAGAASGGAAGGSGATGGSDAGIDTASTAAGTSNGTGGSGASGSAGQPSTTGEPLPPPPVPLGAVLITEYVEGIDGDDKAVELSNVSDETVALTECRLETYFNGNLESSNGVDLTTIELRPQTSYVLCKSSASSVLSSVCDRAAASINFNGDDALVLRCDGVVHDSFGQVGFDPGIEWRSAENTSGSADHVLRRRCGARARTDASAPFEGVLGADWASVWTFDEATSAEFAGLGLAACAEPSDDSSTDISGSSDDSSTDTSGTDSGDGTGGAASE